MSAAARKQTQTVEVEELAPSALDEVVKASEAADSAVKVAVEASIEAYALCCGVWQTIAKRTVTGYVQNGRLHLDMPVTGLGDVPGRYRAEIKCRWES